MVQNNFLTDSISVSTDTASPAMPQHLPKGMKELLMPYPMGHHDALAICALPALAQLAQNACFDQEPDESPTPKDIELTEKLKSSLSEIDSDNHNEPAA